MKLWKVFVDLWTAEEKAQASIQTLQDALKFIDDNAGRLPGDEILAEVLRRVGKDEGKSEDRAVKVEGKKIYIVTSGEYSAYGIVDVFSTKEAAEAYAVEYGGASVEEWDVDVSAGHVSRRAYWSSIDLPTGAINRRGSTKVIASPADRSQPGEFNEEYSSYAAYSFVSQEHADKLAVEYRQKWLRGKNGV